tara:strand:+ start:7317 stop:8639 length:1323 start_codon:yes stop_codon:yes gene_type:complete
MKRKNIFWYLGRIIETKIAERVFTWYLLKVYCSRISKLKSKSSKPRLLWGSVPLINNKYWSQSLNQIGFTSKTIVTTPYSANNSNDFDEIIQDSTSFEYYKFISRILREFDIVHMPYTGFVNERWDFLKKYEYDIFKRAGLKIISIPYGGDAYQYSKIYNYSRKQGLMFHYPQAGKNEKSVSENFNRVVKNSDCVISGHIIEGISFWDFLSFNILGIDLKNWDCQVKKHIKDGINGVVKIIHTPNHRKIKGTEFIIQAIDELKEEGFKIEFHLIENKTNEVVKSLMEEADILVEQLLRGYGLSLIEGMSMNAAVISNLEDDEISTKVFRRFCILDECPALSATPENIKEQLKLLILNPELRLHLGIKGRQYVEKYHSYEMNQYLFPRIYDKIWYNEDIDLRIMFDPNEPNSYNNQSSKIDHPLIENKIPNELMKTLKTEF